MEFFSHSLEKFEEIFVSAIESFRLFHRLACTAPTAGKLSAVRIVQ